MILRTEYDPAEANMVADRLLLFDLSSRNTSTDHLKEF